MSSTVDAHIDHALDAGRRNQAAIALIRRHCSHARVELSGGWSEVESVTGLPISSRSMHCDYAPDTGMSSIGLEGVAVEFYRRNCVGCPHRNVVGVPNLATRVAELDAEIAQAAERAERERRRRVEEQTRRAEARHAAVRDEREPTRRLVGLIDQVDCEESDGDAARRLLAAVRGAPEIVTERAREILVEAARLTVDSRLLQAVGFLGERGEIRAGQVVRCAVAALLVEADVEAARLLLAFKDAIGPGGIAKIAEVVVAMSGSPDRQERLFGIGRRSQGDRETWDALLRACYMLDPPAILGVVSSLLGSPEDRLRLRAAAAAALLLREEAGLVPVLGSELLAALERPEAVAELDWEEASGSMIQEALAAAFVVAAGEAEQLFEAAGARLDDARRSLVFSAITRTVSRFEPEITDTRVARVLDFALRRLNGDWGDDVADRAGEEIDYLTQRHPAVALPRLGPLLGALLDAVRSPVPTYHPLLDPSPQPSIVGALEVMTEQTRRDARIHHLREAVGHVAAFDPEAAWPELEPFLKPSDTGEAEIAVMRGEVVLLLPSLGRRVTLLNRVLPPLYRALLDEDAGIRGHAVRAFGELDRHHRAMNLPSELGELVPALIADPYRYVHKMTISELARGLRVPGHLQQGVLETSAAIAQHYAGHGDTRALEDALTTVVRLGRAIGGETEQVAVVFALRQAPSLSTYSLRDFIRRYGDRMSYFSGYAAALVQLLTAPEVTGNPNGRGAELFAALRELRPDLISGQRQQIREAAFAWLPDRVGCALDFVEILQRGCLFDDAAALAEEIVEYFPQTTQQAVRRTLAECVAAAAHVEAAIARGATDDAEGYLAAWRQAEARLEVARAELDHRSID